MKEVVVGPEREQKQTVIRRKDCPGVVMEWMWVGREGEGSKFTSRFTKLNTQVGLWFPE